MLQHGRAGPGSRPCCGSASSQWTVLRSPNVSFNLPRCVGGTTTNSGIGSKAGVWIGPSLRTSRRLGTVSPTPGRSPLRYKLITHQFAVYNIVMDFMFAIFPWFITWPLNLKRGEKIGLCITLSLGMMYVQQLEMRCPSISSVKVPRANSKMTGLPSSRQYGLGGKTRLSCTTTTTGVSACRFQSVLSPPTVRILAVGGDDQARLKRPKT